MTKVRQEIMPSIRKNKEREKASTFYNQMLTESLANRSDTGAIKKITDHLESIIDIRLFSLENYNFIPKKWFKLITNNL